MAACTGTSEVAVRPLAVKCLAWLMHKNPVNVVVLALLTIMFGFVGYIAAGVISSDHSLVHVVPSHSSLTSDKLWLEVKQPTDARCIRLTTYLVYPVDEPPGVPRQYISLGSALNGLPFPDSVDDYELRLIIPRDMTGDWYYVERAYRKLPAIIFGALELHDHAADFVASWRRPSIARFMVAARRWFA